MYYAVSDIHGCYRKFEKLLDIINFSNDKDVLFVLGDTIDRGDEGIRVLQLMMEFDHIVPIIGNHEKMAYEILRQLESKIVMDSEKVRHKHLRAIYPICGLWFQDGGIPTLRGYSKLRRNERLKVLEYIGDSLPFFELKVNKTKYVMLHAGISDFVPGKELWEYHSEAFLFERMNYEKVYFEDAYIVSGHTPTDLIDKELSGRIIQKNRHIAIDCGAYWGKPLGCICLDTLEEFYSN